MDLGYALFISIISAYFVVLTVSFWADKIGNGIAGKGMLITGLFAFIAILLFLLFAPESWLTPALLIGVGTVVVTLIFFWIFGN